MHIPPAASLFCPRGSPIVAKLLSPRTMMNEVDGGRPKLVALKDVLPQHPAGLNRRRYVKVKEPILRNGVKVYWTEEEQLPGGGDHHDEDYAAVACFSVLYFIAPLLGFSKA